MRTHTDHEDMSEVSVGVMASVKTLIAKWDGEPPEGADPIGHPQCIEVIEIEDDVLRTIYKRDES